MAFPSQQPGLLAPDPRYPGFQFQSQFPIEKILPDFHPIPGYLDPRLICLAWPLGEPSPVSVRRFVFILPNCNVFKCNILFDTRASRHEEAHLIRGLSASSPPRKCARKYKSTHSACFGDESITVAWSQKVILGIKNDCYMF